MAGEVLLLGDAYTALSERAEAKFFSARCGLVFRSTRAIDRSCSRLAWLPESSKPSGWELKETIALMGERRHKLIEGAKEWDWGSGKGRQGARGKRAGERTFCTRKSAGWPSSRPSFTRFSPKRSPERPSFLFPKEKAWVALRNNPCGPAAIMDNETYPRVTASGCQARSIPSTLRIPP